MAFSGNVLKSELASECLMMATFILAGEKVFKVWRALLHPDQRHGEPDRALLAGSLLKVRQESGHWAVILSRGGHFAATIFNVSAVRASGQGKHDAPPYDVLDHKTFHRYVVRCALFVLTHSSCYSNIARVFIIAKI